MSRVINDLGKTCRFNTAILLGHSFAKARLANYDSELSARYAIYNAERLIWHDTVGVKLTSKAWKLSTRIDYSTKRFLSLINSPLHTKITLRDLDELAKEFANIDTGYYWRYYQRNCHNYQFNHQNCLGNTNLNKIKIMKLFHKTMDQDFNPTIALLKSVRNYNDIVNPNTDDFLLAFNLLQRKLTSIKPRTPLSSWAQIKNKEDFFVLGKFDIKETIEKTIVDPSIPFKPIVLLEKAYGLSRFLLTKAL